MTRPPTIPLVARLERIRDLSDDLAREVSHGHDRTDTARAMADAIKDEIDEVLRALNRPKR